jgi:putative ABC transport system permease protein
VRVLRRSPGFSATAILILAVAIGASTAIFSVFDALVLHPLPYREPGQLVRVTENFTRFEITGMQLSALELDDVRAMMRSFSHLAGLRSGDYALTGGGTAEAVSGVQVSASIFPMLDVTPILGGPFRPEDEQWGRHRVVVLSEGVWRRRFGADPNIVGTSVEINRESYRVAGVSRPILDYLGTAWDVWMPLSFAPDQKAPPTRGAKGVDVVGRLKPGISVDAAKRELASVTAQLAARYPRFYANNSGFSLEVGALASMTADSVRQPLLFLLAAVGVLMLIACANVSNLLMARAAARRKEVSIRAALGATRSRVVAQLLTESVVIAGMAGGIGVGLAFALLQLFERSGPSDLVPVTGVGVNAWVLAFAVGVTSLASIVFGLVPALAASAGVHDGLKASVRGSSARGRFRESMVALQVAASLVLLVCAGLLIQSFVRVQQADPGFDPRNVVTFELLLPATHYAEPERRSAFYDAFRARVRAMPGVVAVGAVDRLPFGGRQGGAPLFVVGRAADPNAPQPLLRPARVLPGYFESLGVPLRRGRDFTDTDLPGTAPAAVIDEATVRRFFPDGDDPIGRQIAGVEPGLTSTIVGVVGAVKRRDLSAAPEMGVYHAATQRAGAAMTFSVKTATAPLDMIPAIRRALAELDPQLPLTRAVTMEQRLSASLARRRLSMQLMVFFGVSALLLSALGLFAVLSYVVGQRRREVGIRMALGARPRQVIELVVGRQGLVPVAFGIAGGLAAAFAAARLLTATLFEITPTDPAVYAAVTGLLIVTAIAAMAIPARRATAVDPVAALRDE